MSKKKRYRIRNWSKYNKALVRGGSLTLWFDEDSIKEWHQCGKKRGRGRPRKYADIAIQCMLTLKSVFNLPLRATQGLVASLIELLKLPIEAADYSTVCRRKGNGKSDSMGIASVALGENCIWVLMKQQEKLLLR